MPFTVSLKRFIALFAVGCLWACAAWADDNLHIPGNYQESGFGEQREYQKGQANEYVDPFGGGLKRIYTDYVFPNNGGMDITITRFYNTLQNAASGKDALMGNGKWATTSGGKASMGPGWDIHFGRIWLPMENLGGGELEGRVIPAWKPDFDVNPYNYPNAKTEWNMEECQIDAWTVGGYANQLPVFELPDGSREVLYPTVLLKVPGSPLSGHMSAYMTKNHWIATCLPANENIVNEVGGSFPGPNGQGGLVLYSPAGLRYVFNKKGNLSGFGSTWGQGAQEGYVVTKISDLNGNRLDITYERGADSELVLRPLNITSTSGSATVTVNFNYTSSLLSSITGQDVTISYTHDNQQMLSDVAIATGSGDPALHWHYEYVTTNLPPPADQHVAPFNLLEVTSPTGQVTTYGYETKVFTKAWCAAVGASACALANDRHANVVVKTRSVDGVTWTYDYEPGTPGAAGAENDVTKVTASSSGKTLCTAYEHIGEAATPGEIEASLNRNRNLHRRGLLVKKSIYDGACSGGVLMQTEEMEYGKKAFITNLDDFRPYPATRDTRVWVPLITKKTIKRKNDKTRVTNYSYVGGAYDKDDDPVDSLWKGSFVMTNPVKSTTEVVSGQDNKITTFHPATIIAIGSGLSPELSYKTLDQGSDVVDNGINFLNLKIFNLDNGNQIAALDNGVGTFYERYSNGDIKKLVTMKNAADIGCNSGTFPTAQLLCIAGKTSGFTLFANYKAGVPANITLPDGTTINKDLDVRGNAILETISKTSDPDTTVTGYSYDLLNRVKTVITPHEDDANVAIAYPSFTQTVLTRGRLTKTVTKNTRGLVASSCNYASDAGDPLCQNFAYDPLQNWKLFSSDVSYSSTETEGTQTAYDVLGRITSTGHTGKEPVRYFYNVADKVRGVQKVNGLYATTLNTYRAYGNPDEKFLIKIEQQESGSTVEQQESDGTYITTDLVKNSVGRLESVTQGGKTRTFHYLQGIGLPLWMNWEHNEYQDIAYCYNDGGKISRIYKDITGSPNCSSSSNLTNWMSYDVMDRVSISGYEAFSGALAARDQYFSYDKLGNLKTAALDAPFGESDAKDTWEYSYDLNNNLKSETFTNNEDAPVATYSFGYEYDNLDAMQQLTYPNNQKALYAPDGLGRATKLDYNNGVEVTSLVSGLDYFADGSVHTLTLGNGKNVTNTQTADKMLDTTSVSNNVLSLDYDYDDVGNVTLVTGTNDLMDDISKIGFQYDGLSRLKAVTLPDGNYTYSYNARGGITNKATPVGACVYHYNDYTALLTDISGSSCGETASDVQYDSLKNIRGKNGDVPYTYNSANQLVKQNGSFYAEYDANGHRFRAVTSQVNLSGTGVPVNAPYLNLFSKSGKNLVEIDHQVDNANAYAKKNYRNHLYFGSMHFSSDHCDTQDVDANTPAGKNYALGICGDADDDHDGLTYQQELDAGTYPFNADSDHDGLKDGQELILGTNLLLADTDHDGLLDSYENAKGYDPLHDVEGALDLDGDSLTNHEELLHYTDPLRADTDADTLPDGWEVAHNRNPLQADYQVATGESHACALDDTGVHCWGNNYDQSSIPPLIAPKQISMFGPSSCAIDLIDLSVSVVKCWGNSWNQGTQSLVNPSQVSAGYDHACALDDNGVHCWGKNSNGELTVPPLSAPKQVSAGQDFTCALDQNGVQCWGRNDFGQLSVPTIQNARQISAGYYHACALDDTGVHCWGDGSHGEKNVPVLVNPSKVSVGPFATCALDDVGVHCWGFSYTNGSQGLVKVPNLVHPTQVSLGFQFGCALDDGGVECWTVNGSQYSFDGATTVPVLDIDPDQDGLNNADELAAGSDRFNSDSDGDGLPDGALTDNCPMLSSTDQTDNDGDGHGNACDAFPSNVDEYLDTDGDGTGDNDDTDDDNDGVLDTEDFLPLIKGVYPGKLDFSFDADGKLTTPVVSGVDRINAIIQCNVASDPGNNGKLVAVGYSNSAATGDDFTLARYNSDGSLDDSFGSGGIVKTTIGAGAASDQAVAVAQQTDGKLVVAGNTGTASSSDFVVVRYNTNGSPDATFGSSGIKIIVAAKEDVAKALVLQADGKLVIAGYSNTAPSGTNYDFAVQRLTNTGGLDTDFGTNSKTTVAVGTSTDQAAAIIQQAVDGKLVAAGYAYMGGSGASNADFALVRFNTDGTLDTGFGSGGKVTTAIVTGATREDRATALLQQTTDGKLVAAGYSLSGSAASTANFAMVRYNTNGSLDTDFGSGGAVIADVGSNLADKATGIILQADNKLVMAGTSGSNAVALMCFISTGTLDTTFDDDGIVTTLLGGSGAATALTKQADDKLVVAGYSNDDFALLRYIAAGQDTDGDGLTDVQESALVTNPFSSDTDGDGLTDSQEASGGSNPLLADTDGDGLIDGQSFQVNVLAHKANFSMDKAWLLAIAQPPGLNAATLDVVSVSNIGSYSHGVMNYNSTTGQVAYTYNTYIPANSMFSVTLRDNTAATRTGIIAITMLPVGTDLSLYAAANQQIVIDETSNGGIYGGGAGDDILLDGLGNDTLKFGIGSGDDLAYFDDATQGRTDTLQFGAAIGKDDVHLAAQGDDLVVSLSQTGTLTGDTLTLIDYAQDVFRHAMTQMMIGGTATGYAAVGDVIVQAQETCVITSIDSGNPANSVLAWQGISPVEMLRNDFNATASPLVLNTMSLAGTSGNVIGAPDYVDNWGFVSLSLLLQNSCLPSSMSYRVANHESVGAGEGYRGSVEVYPIAPAYTIQGSARNESLYGLDDTAETFIGNGGNDRLYTGNGPDTIQFNLGDGHDTVDLQGEMVQDSGDSGDTLLLGAGILPATTTVVRDGLDLLVQPSTVDQVRLQGYFANDAWTLVGFPNWGAGVMNFNLISFSGGTSWTHADVEANIQTAKPCANPVSCAGNNTFAGTAGNDVVFGWAGNDVLSGGAGDDQLMGDAGDDTLIPGSGNNWLSGGAGVDTYKLDANSGTTTIENFDLTTGQAHFDFTGVTVGHDRILFPDYVLDSNVQLLRENTDLIVKVTDGTNTSVTHVLGFYTDYGFSKLDIVFDSATPVTWDPDCIDFSSTQHCIINRTLTDALLDDGVSTLLADDNLVFDYSYDGAPSIHGGLGNDHITSDGTDDTLYGDDGNDVLDSGGGATDVLYGGNGNDTLFGGWGGNTLFGEAGDDTLLAVGPYGNNVLNGGTGDDIYQLTDDAAVTVQTQATAGNSGEDTVQFTGTLLANQLWMEFQGSNLIIHVLGSTWQFVVAGWDESDSQLSSIQAGSCSISRSNLRALVVATNGVQPTTQTANDALVTAYWVCP